MAFASKGAQNACGDFNARKSSSAAWRVKKLAFRLSYSLLRSSSEDCSSQPGVCFLIKSKKTPC
ncbi:hypothetical protein [Pseudomonas sp. KK4]|uniref:hypothetical protein n=1 Tax=Pseudomonas sp. KK4 TaxID=1855729 RepID=UPI00211544CF|nr:hypothetical protein [Pseudomonas sp. KK4]